MVEPHPRAQTEEAGEPLAEGIPEGTFLEVVYGADPPQEERAERSA